MNTYQLSLKVIIMLTVASILVLVWFLISRQIIQRAIPIFYHHPYDKIGHFCLYGLYAVVGMVIAVVFRIPWYYVLLILFAVGTVHEYTHHLDPRREFSLGDLAANFGGVIVGVGLFLIAVQILWNRPWLIVQ